MNRSYCFDKDIQQLTICFLFHFVKNLIYLCYYKASLPPPTPIIIHKHFSDIPPPALPKENTISSDLNMGMYCA